MRSKHLSVRKCIDKKPDKIKGIVCICIILAVVCAGNMIPNFLISLKAAKIAKASTTISNAERNARATGSGRHGNANGGRYGLRPASNSTAKTAAR